jgi:peptidoglycan hydrolase-like protein with peptidoglycan-binding domain
MKSVSLPMLTALATLVAPGLMGQTTVHIAQAPVGRVQVPRVQVNLTPQHPANPSNVRTAGFPSEIRSVQAALRRLGIYSGQVDGILGPDTQRAIEDYQVKNKLPVTGQPNQGLYALLGIF